MKMLKEEKELRQWMDALPTLKCKPAGRKFYSDIRALVRAVREDDAKVAEGHDREIGDVWLHGKDIAAKIRGRK